MGRQESGYAHRASGLAVVINGLKIPDDIDGLVASGDTFANEKLHAMLEAFGEIDTNRLQRIGFTTAFANDTPYVRPRRGRRDMFASKYTDNAHAFRGVLFGDLLISALAREGKIISGLHNGTRAVRTAVYTTSNFVDAQEFAMKACKKTPGELKQHVYGL